MSNDLIEVRAIRPPNVGWLEVFLNKEAMDKLWSYVDVAKENVNHKLAGQITKSLKLEDKDDWFLNNVILQVRQKYEEEFGIPSEYKSFINDKWYVELKSFWVNFMNQNESNPYHNHTGVYSFNIWMKIPTDWKEQHELPIVKNSNFPTASNFQFFYTDMMGNQRAFDYRLDKSCEGKMVFFPAKLMHTVYPFYNCDETRISIAGNLGINVVNHD